MKNINPGTITLMWLRLCLAYPESVAWFMLLWIFNTPGRNAERKLWAKVIWQIPFGNYDLLTLGHKDRKRLKGNAPLRSTCFVVRQEWCLFLIRGQERGSVLPVTLPRNCFPLGSRLPPVTLAVGKAAWVWCWQVRASFTASIALASLAESYFA